MIPEGNIISVKASAAGAKGAGGARDSLSPSVGGLGSRAPLENFQPLQSIQIAGKKDLNVAETTTVQDHKHIKVNGGMHIQC